MKSVDMPWLRARRIAVFGLVFTTSGAASWVMAGIVGAGGVTLLEVVILALFVPTFTWIVLPFWTSVIGFVLTALRRDPMTLARVHRRDTMGPSPVPVSRTAIVMPIHEEDADAVAARLSAIARDLERAGQGAAFDVHILSDTRRDSIAQREEEAWARLQGMHPELAFYYRRRTQNTGRKAGNIAEFCDRCADDYEFMVVLDADSLMGGGTLARLVRIMEANPDVGLLQTAPGPARQTTLFGRLVQFASQVHGVALSAGLAFWQGDGANYRGHNAIVRLKAFSDHARLPVLPGRPPWGGEILSHDFVEAALLRRAGWKVVFDASLGDTWEEVPGNLVGFAARDRRWAQGSLQHLRLLTLPGLHGLSRLHFVMGAMGYVSSLLWLLILVAGSAYVFVPALAEAGTLQLPLSTPAGLSLLAGTAVLLFLPKILGLILALLRSPASFGGSLRLAVSGFLEILFSVLLAPLLMLWHARFVLEIVAGRAVGWDPRYRSGAFLSWREAAQAGIPATLVGVLWSVMTLALSPVFFLWMSPIFLGLLLAIPLIRWTSSARLGLLARRAGLFMVPTEVFPSPVLRGAEADHASDPDELMDDVHPGFAPDHKRGVGVFERPDVRSPSRVGRGGSHMYDAERGLFEMQRGRPFLVEPERPHAPVDGASAQVIAAVEGLNEERLAELRTLGGGGLSLVVTGHRAVAMQWTAQRPVRTADAVALPLESSASSTRIVELASDPTVRLNGQRRHIRPASEPEAAGLALAHMGRLLPAVVAADVTAAALPGLQDAVASGRLLGADAGDVLRFVSRAGSTLEQVSEAPVPVPQDENSRFILFRDPHGLREHVAVLVGSPETWPDPVPVRIHSACLTGDLFASLRCDCGEQLRGSMTYFAKSGGGVLLYLAQEGRGIGLGNKLRAYTIQGSGLDTIDADRTLGFGADERRYEVAVGMLRAIGVRRVELLTNNPEKVRALEKAGIEVARRQSLHGQLNRHNLPYMKAKAGRAGHWLRDMLTQPVAGD
jgi:membrane glycosyltransferase